MKDQGKVLVAYASKYGATAGIAEAIAVRCGKRAWKQMPGLLKRSETWAVIER
jgi:hypothetical protein